MAVMLNRESMDLTSPGDKQTSFVTAYALVQEKNVSNTIIDLKDNVATRMKPPLFIVLEAFSNQHLSQRYAYDLKRSSKPCYGTPVRAIQAGAPLSK
jgi:hypothetical protein